MNTPAHDAVKVLAQRILDMGYDDMPARERHVIERVARKLAVSRDLSVEFEQDQSFGERLADRVASFGGSWTFLIIFGAALACWILLNSVILARAGAAFDPYPYILLNLFLSLIAAIQAPIIMMSQNRLSQQDRLQATHDYEVNLKAEIEIMALHEKLDEIRNKEMAQLVQRICGS